MNIERFIANRILFNSSNSGRISRPIVRVAVLGISLGIAVMIITTAVVTGFQNEIKKKIIGFGGHIQVTAYNTNTSEEPSPVFIDSALISAIKAIKGIEHVEYYAVKNGLVKTKNDNEGVMLKGVTANHNWSFIKQNLVSGSLPVIYKDSISKDIAISQKIADRLGLNINDKLIIYFITPRKDGEGYEQRVKDFIIRGIYNSGYEELDKKAVFVDIKQIQKLNYWLQDQVGGYEILVSDLDKLDEIGELVYETIGTDLNSKTIRESNVTIFSWLDLQDVNAAVVIVLMLLVAVINMVSALLILILERTGMIGILKALGQDNLSIQMVFLYNAAYLIGKGLLFGNVFGIGLCLIQQQFGLFTLPQETYYVSEIPVNLSVLNILLLNVGTMLTCILMLMLPSFIISKLNPVKAIRFS